MKTLKDFISEALDVKKIKFKGTVNVNAAAQEYDADLSTKKIKGNEAYINCQINSIKDLDCKDLLKQGCKWVLLVPPHESNGNPVDYYNVRMFITKKRVFDGFKSSEEFLVYDLKKEEFVNKEIIDKKMANDKVYRVD